MCQAELVKKLGNIEEARTLVMEAHRFFCELGVKYWVKKSAELIAELTAEEAQSQNKLDGVSSNKFGNSADNSVISGQPKLEGVLL